MKASALTLGLICSLPIAVVWLVFRGAQWERRKGFHGTYEQPRPPRRFDDLDAEQMAVWAECVGRRN